MITATIQKGTAFDFSQLASELFTLTNKNWILQKDDHTHCEHYTLTLENGNGEAIYLEKDGYRTKGKIHISGKSHIGNKYLSPDKRNSINCTASKSPAQIAKDIQRRFLDEYLTEFNKQYLAHCQWEEKKAKRQQMLISLAKIIGYKREISLETDQIHGYGKIQDIKAFTDGEIILNIRTDASNAETILKLLTA